MASLIRHFIPTPAPAPVAISTKPAVPTTPASTRHHIDDNEHTANRPLSLTHLPPEIHLLIASHLIYPDALSLKHTSRHYYHLVDTGVKLKIDWLVERRRLHLECPNNQRCDLGSDLRFCRGSVRYVLARQ